MIPACLIGLSVPPSRPWGPAADLQAAAGSLLSWRAGRGAPGPAPPCQPAMAAGCGTAAWPPSRWPVSRWPPRLAPATAARLARLVRKAPKSGTWWWRWCPPRPTRGLYIAQAKGLFTKVGLHVTIKPVVSAQAVIPSMLHGSVDVDGGGYVTYILAQAKGIAKIRILAAGFALGPHVTEIVALPRANIQSPADLRGKTIAVNQLGGLASDLTYTALAPYGITPGQVHLVAMPFPAMPGALAAGKIDAAYETEPFVTEAVKKYGVQAVADLDGGATQDFPLTGYAVLASWAARYPRTAAAFTKAIEQGNAIAATNLAVLQQVLSASLHLSP